MIRQLTGRHYLEEWFPNLRESRMVDTAKGYVYEPSVLHKIGITDGVLDMEENNTGTFQGTADFYDTPLEQYASYFHLDGKNIQGTVTKTGEEYEFILEIESFEGRFSLAALGFTMQSAGFRLYSRYEDDKRITESGEYPSVSMPILFVRGRFGFYQQQVEGTSLPFDTPGRILLKMHWEDGIALSGGVSSLSKLFGLDTSGFILPGTLQKMDIFRIQTLEIGIRSFSDELLSLMMNLYIDCKWVPSVSFFQLQKIGVEWSVSYTGTEPIKEKLVGTLYAKAALGGQKEYEIDARCYLPDADISGTLTNPKQIPLQEILKSILGIHMPLLSEQAYLEFGSVYISPTLHTFEGTLSLKDLFSIQIGKATCQLQTFTVDIMSDSANISVSASGGFYITGDTQNFQFGARIQYKDSEWRFFASLLSGEINVVALLLNFCGMSAPEWTEELPNLTDFLLDMPFRDGTAYFTLHAALEKTWQTTILGNGIRLKAVVDLERSREQNFLTSLNDSCKEGEGGVYLGTLTGEFEMGLFLVRASAAFTNADAKPQYTFRIQYEEIFLEALISWKKTPSGDKKLSVKEHPVLTIHLGGLTLGGLVEKFVYLVNPNSDFKLTAPWNILNTLSLDKFEMQFDPTLKTVTVLYQANLDLVIMRADTVGVCFSYGQGENKVQFVLTGDFLGYSYTSEEPLSWDAIREEPPRVPGKDKEEICLHYLGLGQHFTTKTDITKSETLASAMELMEKEMAGDAFFDGERGWTIGIDLTLYKALRLKILFCDPVLYGVNITMDGEDAGSFNGLSLDIMYKKVTKEIGVFQARLLLPVQFRHFELGFVSVTLGRIGIDIYTSGNFKIDLGFPSNQDFSESFSIQAGIYTGEGGLYFGVLTSEICEELPDITNGVINPLIAIGVGLRLGIGRTFNVGILKAELALELVVVLEGMFGVFHPTAKELPTASFYQCTGMAGLTGRMVAVIDFKIIKISLSLEITALVCFQFEAYKKTYVALSLEIKAEASIKILFIKIKFSFHMKLKTDFSFGKEQTPPWIMEDRTNTNQLLKRQLRNMPMLESVQDSWEVHTYENIPDSAVIHIAPLFTKDQISINISNALPEKKVVFLVSADSPVAVEGEDVDVLVHSSLQATGIYDTSFCSICRLLVSWILSENGGIEEISYIQLKQIGDVLKEEGCREENFNYEKISLLFEKNMVLKMSFVPNDMGEEISGVFFPMPPELVISLVQGQDKTERDFKSYHLMTADYENQIREYMSKLSKEGKEESDFDETGESFASFLFCDYFYTLSKSCIEHMISLLECYPYTGKENSLEGIVAWFPEEIMNDVSYSPTAESIAIENQNWDLLPNQEINLGTFDYITGQKDNFDTVAAYYGADIQKVLLANSDSNMVDSESGLLVESYRVNNMEDITLPIFAASVYMRIFGLEDDVTVWYRETIARENHLIDGELGESIMVPSSYGDDSQLVSWKVLPGDTLWTIAGTLALIQNALLQPEEYTEFLQEVQGLNPDGDAAKNYLLPDKVWSLGTCRTVREVAAWLFADFEEDYGQMSLLLGKITIKPYQNVTVPDICTVTEEENLSELAKRFGISIEELARRVKNKDILKPASKENPIWVPDVLRISGNELIQTMMEIEIGKISAEVSRFFLNGLRLPSYEKDTQEELQALYELTGQQFEGAQPDDEQPDEAVLQEVFITKSKPEVSWISFYESASIQEEEQDRLFTDRECLEQNPGIPLLRNELKGKLVHLAEMETLNYSITNGMLKAGYPSDELTFPEGTILEELSVYQDVPANYDFQTKIKYFAKDGQMGFLYPFGQAMMKAEDAKEILIKSSNGRTIREYRLASLYQIKLKKCVEGIYQLEGVPYEERESLLQLWKNGCTQEDRLELSLLLSPIPTDSLQDGLITGSVGEQEVIIGKSSLSTETVSASVGNKEEAYGQYTAAMDEPREFLRLLWECTVTGGGSWIRLGTQVTLSEESGCIWLLVMDAREDNSIRKKYHNTLVLLELLEDSEKIYLEYKDVMLRKGVLPSGYAGIHFTTAEPQEVSVTHLGKNDATILTRNLYSLLSTELVEDSDFYAFPDSLPLLPCTKEEGIWDFRQDYPLYRFAVVDSEGLKEGLPNPEENPYRGMDGNHSAHFRVRFRDTVGNITSSYQEIDVAYGYTDALLPILTWPGFGAYFLIEKKENSPYLTIHLQHTIKLFGKDGEQALERLRQVYYQIGNSDVISMITTNILCTEEERSYQQEISIDSLRNVVSSSYLLQKACTCLIRMKLSGNTISEICKNTGLRSTEIAQANSSLTFAEILKEPSVQLIPKYSPFLEGVCMKNQWEGRWNEILAYSENQEIPLKENAKIYLNRQINSQNDQTFQEIASRYNCPLNELIEANADIAGLLQPGAVFWHQGEYAVKVAQEGADKDITLNELCENFYALYELTVSAVELIIENEEVCQLRSDIELTMLTAYTENGDTISNNHIQIGIEEIIKYNEDAIDLFESGALFVTEMMPLQGNENITLTEAATICHCTEAAILDFLSDEPLLQEGVLENPYAWEFPEKDIDRKFQGQENTIHYLEEETSPEELSKRFEVTIEALGELCAQRGDILVAGKILNAPDGRTEVIRAGDSLKIICCRLQKEDTEYEASELMLYNKDVKMFASNVMLLIPVKEQTFEIELIETETFRIPQGMFPIQAQIWLRRNQKCVHPAFIQEASVYEAGSILAPFYDNKQGAEALHTFAAMAEEALPEICIATGTGNDENVKNELWGIRFGINGIQKLVVKGAKHADDRVFPRFFAISPLNRVLLTRNQIEIFELTDQGTLSEEGNVTDFTDIDLELWASIYLQDVEEQLSSELAGNTARTQQGRNLLSRLLEGKKKLAKAISSRTTSLIEGQNELMYSKEALGEAVEWMRQCLLESLTNSSNIHVLVQYECFVESVWDSEWARFAVAAKVKDIAGIRISKLSLCNNQNSCPGFLTLALSAAQSVQQKNLSLESLQVSICELEYNIRKQNDYEASEWVSMVTPLNEHQELPVNLHLTSEIPAPVPLCHCPSKPEWQSHTADAKKIEDVHKVVLSSIRELFQWDYAFRGNFELKAQDELDITVYFNRPISDELVNGEDLFVLLAQYHRIREGLLGYLKHFQEEQALEEADYNAFTTFCMLTEKIAGVWGQWSAKTRGERLLENVSCHAIVTLQIEDGKIKRLLLKQDGQIKYKIQVVYHNKEGESFWLTQMEGENDVFLFGDDFAPDPSQSIMLTFLLEDIHMMSCQSAETELFIRRNRNLLEEYDEEISSQFQYVTTTVSSPEVISPSIVYQDPLELSAWTWEKESNPMTLLMQEIIRQCTAPSLQCTLYLKREVLAGKDFIRIPVAHKPRFVYQEDFVQELIDTAKKWQESVPEITGNIWWSVSLTLYADLAIIGERTVPLVTFEDLSMKLSVCEKNP